MFVDIGRKKGKEIRNKGEYDERGERRGKGIRK